MLKRRNHALVFCSVPEIECVFLVCGSGNECDWERTKRDRWFERLEEIEVDFEEDPFEKINDPYLQIQLEQAWI